MDKVAMIKSAEVRGVLACLVDNNLIKIANEEAFEAIADTVAGNLGDDYNLEDVLDGTASVVETAEALDNLSDEELAELAAAVDAEQAEGDVAAPVAEVVPEVVPEDIPKEASDTQYSATQYKDLMAQYGELVMAKEAGDISDKYFEKQAGMLQDGLRQAQGLGKIIQPKLVNAKDKLVDGLSFDRLRAFKRSKGTDDFKKKLLMQGLKQSGAAYGGVGLGALGVGKMVSGD